MSKKKNFTCSICGKKHTIYSYIEGGISETLQSIPENEKEERLIVSEELQVWIVDKEYVVKKLGLKVEEFDAIMNKEPKSHFDYEIEGAIESHYPLLTPLKMIYNLFR